MMRKRRDHSKDPRSDGEMPNDVDGQASAAAGVAAEGDALDVDENSEAADSTGDRIAELERELTFERDKHLRLVAEFDNFRKRMYREKLEAASRGQAELAKTLLDPLDDIARFAHVDPVTTDSATIVEGVDMVEKKLDKSLRAAGLDTINPIGERFDPSLHEAVGTDTAESPDLDGIVSRVYQSGYTFRGQLLRPARVVVTQYTANADD